MDDQQRRIKRPERPSEYLRALATGVERPFGEDWYPDLLEVATAEWDDVFTLVAIYFEAQLRVRRRPTSRAVRVVDAVKPRLEELLGRPFPDDPDELAGLGPFGDTSEWPEVGLLAHMGYRVGRDGLPVSERRMILGRVFDGPVPNVNDPEYMGGWGPDGSPARLQKMAWSIASFARSAQRRTTADVSVAAHDWIDDLHWLRATYHEGHFGFPWPDLS